MPKSKRNKQIELSKTKKRGLDWKKKLFEEVRSSVDSYSNVFVFAVNDMRNSKMKNVREQWKHSRFFIGKNKIMAMALGRFAEEEYKPNLHKLGQRIKGQRGLLFSNKPLEEVLSWFRSYSEDDYARSGNAATENVFLNAGPLPMFPHNLEPYLRQLGLPTSLEKGVIHLVKDHEVCKVGDILTPETARILKYLDYKMAEFQISIDCVWSQDGTFMQLSESIDTDAKENIKVKKKTSLGTRNTEVISNSIQLEEMDVEMDDDDDDDDEDIDNSEIKNNTSDITSTSLNNECNGLKEDNVSELQQNSDKSSVQDKADETPVTEANEISSINASESVDLNKDQISNMKSNANEILSASDNESIDFYEDTSTEKSHPSNRKAVKDRAKVSLPKTPDASNSKRVLYL